MQYKILLQINYLVSILVIILNGLLVLKTRHIWEIYQQYQIKGN
jgi:hypothetical protein